MAEMREMLTQIQDNTNKLLEDNQALRKQYADLHESLNFHIAKVEKLETENQTLKKEVRLLKTSLEEVKEDNDAMAEDLATAINKIDDLEQYSRKHNLEFHGIPESSQENLAEQIIKLGNVLKGQVALEDNFTFVQDKSDLKSASDKKFVQKATVALENKICEQNNTPCCNNFSSSLVHLS